MKKPEDIKKGLECCVRGNCIACPYSRNCVAKNADALALIQKLQAENTEKAEKIKKLEKSLSFAWELGDGLKADNIKLEQEIDALKHRTKQLEAERDAAVKDIERTCSTCKHYYYNNDEGCEYDCVVGPDGCHNGNTKWQWRGVQKEE